MQCPHCQHTNSIGAKFCSECGGKLEARCTQCGATTGPMAKFCPECGAALSRPEVANSLPSEIATAREERRWATLLFADLSDFTALSEQLDPEDVKALAHRCTERLS